MSSSQSFFENLPDSDRELIRSRCASRHVNKGEVVVHQGGMDRELFIVVSGRLRISAISDEGKEVGFGILQADDTFGEMSMLDAEPRSATVTAIEPCELLALDRPAFNLLVEDHPQMAVRLLVILSQRLRQTTRVYENAVFMTVAARLAGFLLEFAKPRVAGEGADWVFDVVLSQYELGTLINASRESVSKLISEWEDQSIIERRARHIHILDRARLEQISRSAK